ncbi:MAG: MFS transporter [Alphaproteobacteria bacterium]|nr:MFS transporter [Alphaproteobacteria bacterium]
MRRLFGSVYYGWYVVGACNCVAAMTWGVGIFNQGVFLAYFVERFGWSPATMSVGSMLFHIWAGIVGIMVGRVIDRRGPRAILVTGAIMLAAGAVTFGTTLEIWQVFAGFFILSTGFACLHTVTLGKIVARWFLRQRARAMALATFGAGVGGALLVPLNASVLERWGGPAGGAVLAVIVLVMVVPLALFVFKDGPESLGLEPDGWKGDDVPADAQSAHNDRREWTTAEALRTPAFWALSVSFFCAMLAQSGLLLHQMMFLQITFGLVGAASVVTLTTVMGMVGRTLFAVFGNRWRSRDVASVVLLLQAAAFTLFAVHPAPWSLIVGSGIFGFTMGLVVILQPLATAECFGQRSFGRVFGPIYMWVRVGSAIGPVIIGVIYAASGDYTAAWIVLALALLFAAISVRWAVAPPAAAPA